VLEFNFVAKIRSGSGAGAKFFRVEVESESKNSDSVTSERSIIALLSQFIQ